MDLVARPWRIPLEIRFRGTNERRGSLLRGPRGWGEFSPFPDYGPRLARRWYDAALEAATRPWPEPVRTRVAVNAIVPAVDATTAHRLVIASGCTTAKVKVAEGDDDARVEAVRAALGPSGKLRIDANGAWNVDEAAARIKRLSRFDLEYVEQPVQSLDEMAALRPKVDVPLAADESVRTAEDPLRVARLEAADVLVLKVHPIGGVRRCMEVAEAAGLPCVVSSAVETSIGLAAGLALAAALPELPYACGLGTASLLAGDVVDDPLVPRAGFLEVRRPEVSPDALARWELRGAEAEHELRRLEAAREASP